MNILNSDIKQFHYKILIAAMNKMTMTFENFMVFEKIGLKVSPDDKC